MIILEWLNANPHSEKSGHEGKRIDYRHTVILDTWDTTRDFVFEFLEKNTNVYSFRILNQDPAGISWGKLAKKWTRVWDQKFYEEYLESKQHLDL